MFTDLTIGVCFYRTPHLLLPFLKSIVANHPETSKFKIIVSENSPALDTYDTQILLDKYKIPYIRNPDMTHNPAVDLLLNKATTKYFLLCDSDILILKPLYDLFDLFVRNDLTSMGEIQGDRGGYKFVCPRVAPYWNLLNLERIKQNKITFYDRERVVKTSSEGFFGNVPLQHNLGGAYYDTGTSLFEDLTKNGLKIGKINSRIGEYVCHYEAQSWGAFTNIPGYISRDNEIKKRYMIDSKKFENIDISGKFY